MGGHRHGFMLAEPKPVTIGPKRPRSSRHRPPEPEGPAAGERPREHVQRAHTKKIGRSVIGVMDPGPTTLSPDPRISGGVLRPRVLHRQVPVCRQACIFIATGAAAVAAPCRSGGLEHECPAMGISGGVVARVDPRRPLPTSAVPPAWRYRGAHGMRDATAAGTSRDRFSCP